LAVNNFVATSNEWKSAPCTWLEENDLAV